MRIETDNAIKVTPKWKKRILRPFYRPMALPHRLVRHVNFANQSIIRKMFHAGLSIYVYLCIQL